MITKKGQSKKGLIVKAGFRPAGKMEKDGNSVSWADAYQIFLLSFEEEKEIEKFVVEDEYGESIMQQLETVHWGCFVELEFENRKVVSVNILADVLADFYDEE